MDEVLEVADVAADAGLESALAWLVRLVGVVVLLAGGALWLYTDFGLLWVPALLLVAGVALLAAPSVLFGLVELVE
ncbi:hypothetical protein [Halobacterium yunchengense]|uniref:hypothetical protein n=1 Tax=Halobacterium yunchengense TaxID=3108497 RepID=UPI00300BBE7D